MTSNSKPNLSVLVGKDKETFVDAIKKIDDSLTRVRAERELIKTTIEDVADKIGLDKKLIRKMAKTYHNASFKMDVEDNNYFETLYKNVFGDK